MTNDYTSEFMPWCLSKRKSGAPCLLPFDFFRLLPLPDSGAGRRLFLLFANGGKQFTEDNRIDGFDEMKIEAGIA